MNIQEYVMDGLKSEGADDIILTTTQQKATQVKFAKGKILVTKEWITKEMDVFASFDSRIVTTSLKRFDKEAADKTIKLLVDLQNAVPKNEEYTGIAKGPFDYEEIEEYSDAMIESFDSSKAVSDELDRYPDKELSGVLETECATQEIITSNDVKVHDHADGIYYSVRALNPGSKGSGHFVGCSRKLDKIDISAITDEAVRIAMLTSEPKTATPGKFPVLFSAFAAANIIDYTISSLSAFNVDSGMSPFAGKVGKKVGSQKLTMYDYGNLSNGFATAKFDEEGRPTQKTLLFDKGVLKSYLHNTTTAAKHGQIPTGNAGVISPEPTNAYIEGGEKSEAEIIAGIKEGYYVTNLWYTRFNNYVTGDFSTIPRDAAFYIKDGKIVKTVKDIRISDNLVRMLSAISEVGKDRSWIKSWEVETPAYLPAILIDDINITKSN